MTVSYSYTNLTVARWYLLQIQLEKEAHMYASAISTILVLTADVKSKRLNIASLAQILMQVLHETEVVHRQQGLWQQ